MRKPGGQSTRYNMFPSDREKQEKATTACALTLERWRGDNTRYYDNGNVPGDFLPS